MLWDGTVKGWHEGDHLKGAAAKAGFDLAAMDAAIFVAARCQLVASAQMPQAGSLWLRIFGKVFGRGSEVSLALLLRLPFEIL